jgi:hypothetical protein
LTVDIIVLHRSPDSISTITIYTNSSTLPSNSSTISSIFVQPSNNFSTSRGLIDTRAPEQDHLRSYTTTTTMSSQQTEFFKDNLPAQQEVTTPDSVPSSPELGSSSSSDSIASLGSPASPLSPPVSQPVADSFVFAFDIDGVLVRGGRAIPEALQAMKVLNGDNKYGIQV